MKDDANTAAMRAGIRVLAVRTAITALIIGAAFAASFAWYTSRSVAIGTVELSSLPGIVIDNDWRETVVPAMPVVKKPIAKRPAKREHRAKSKPTKRKQIVFTYREAHGG